MWWVLSRSLRQLQILYHSTFFLSSLSCTLHMKIFTDGSSRFCKLVVEPLNQCIFLSEGGV